MSKFTAAYRWPDGIKCAVAFSADVDGESPFIWLNHGVSVPTLGDVEHRRFGPRVGLYRIMDLLDEFSIKGTFFTPGLTAKLFPSALPDIVERGHEIALHGYYHEHVHTIDVDENARAIDRSMEILLRQTGLTPRGYRSPAWEMTIDVLEVVPENRTAVLGGIRAFTRRISRNGEATEFFGGLQGESGA